MKTSVRGCLLFIVFILTPSILFAADFRGVSWGMDRGQVKEKECLELMKETTDELSYHLIIEDLGTILEYKFTKDMLTSSEYKIVEKRLNTNLYIADYGKIQALLKKKYGKPTTFKFITDESGAVLDKGGLTIISLWNIGETEIVHLLTGTKSEIQHIIRYRSREYQNLEKTADKSRTQDEL